MLFSVREICGYAKSVATFTTLSTPSLDPGMKGRIPDMPYDL